MAASPWSAGTSAVTLPSAQLRDGAAETGRQWIVTSADDLVPLPGGGRSVVHRRGDVVIRDAGPWTPAVHALLRHLEDVGFAVAPRLAGSCPPRSGPARFALDGYGLTARQRRGFLSQMIEFAICDTAAEADDAAITPETTAHPDAPWAMAWRARSAAWMIRNRRTLETALTRGAP